MCVRVRLRLRALQVYPGGLGVMWVCVRARVRVCACRVRARQCSSAQVSPEICVRACLMCVRVRLRALQAYLCDC